MMFISIAWAGDVSEVELQWVICEPSEETFFAKLGVDAGMPRERLVYYSETPSMDLFRFGIVVRTRVSGAKLKTAVKVKYQNENQIPWSLLTGTDFKCEWNVYAFQENIDCSMKSKPRDLGHVISREQQEFIRFHTGFDRIPALRRLGPVQSREWLWRDSRVQGELAFESISLQSQKKTTSQASQASQGRLFNMELSVRVTAPDKAEVFQKLGEWLKERNVHLCQNQKGKSEALLKELRNP